MKQYSRSRGSLSCAKPRVQSQREARSPLAATGAQRTRSHHPCLQTPIVVLGGETGARQQAQTQLASSTAHTHPFYPEEKGISIYFPPNKAGL